jgi:hypothetical protein
MKNLSWFEDRLGFTILRGTTEVTIKSLNMAKKLFEIQGDSYTFSDKIRIHRAPMEECESCSA